MQRATRACFMRGGTSKGVIFHRQDLPEDRSEWDALFLSVMGSPDPNGRQLDGMGGGLSSVSKVCIVAPSSRSDADVDYTFAQVLIDEARVDYSGNCGNMSSAIGPFAIDEGLIAPGGDETAVRIYNTNTGKVIRSTFGVEGGRAKVQGDLAIPGVPGTGAPIRLDFLQPGGATTGKLLPTGRARDMLEVPGVGTIDVSMVDAANACVFVSAHSLGLTGTELPQHVSERDDLMEALAAIRVHASVAMGIAPSISAAREKRTVPFIGFVSPPQSSRTLAGTVITAEQADLTVRMLSNGKPHLALPLTASLCTAVCAQIPGSVVHEVAQPGDADQLRLAMPSGVLHVGAVVQVEDGLPVAKSGAFYRTARRLFDGVVYG